MSSALIQIQRAYRRIAELRDTADVTVTLEMREHGILLRAHNSSGALQSESMVLWDWLADPSNNWPLDHIDRLVSAVAKDAA